MDTEQLNQIALANMGHRKTHKGREPGYIYHHGRRTAQIALRLASQVSGPVDRDILRAAALFHDVGKGVEPHNESGARIARELLSELCEPEEVDGICEIILQHSQRQHPNDYTLETRIVQDADILDHVGPLGPWLQFYWSATHDETIDDALRFFHGRGEGHRAVMRRLLNLAVSVLIFDQRIEFEDRFFAEFERVHREGHRGEGNMPETTAAAIVTAGDSKEPKVLLTRRTRALRGTLVYSRRAYRPIRACQRRSHPGDQGGDRAGLRSPIFRILR